MGQIDTGWVAALGALLGTAITAILTAAAAFWLKLWPVVKESRELRAKQQAEAEERKARQERDSTELTARTRREAFEQVTAEYGEMLRDLREDRSRFERKVDQLYEEIRKLQRDHAECVARNERLQANMNIMQAEIESVRVKQDLANMPTRVEAIVVANEKGIIVEWNQAATVLFHYKAREAVGMSVAELVPDSYLVAHDTAWADVRATRRMPKRGPYRTEARTKEGELVPVEITLSGWEENGRLVVSAAIARYVLPPGRQDVFQSGVAIPGYSGPEVKVEQRPDGGARVDVPPGGQAVVQVADTKVTVQPDEPPPAAI